MEYKAMYNFTTSNPDELAFQKGSILKVLRREDKNWFLAELDAKQGLIPENYVTAHRAHDWYAGKVTRKEAEGILMKAKNDGAFMIRDSESSPEPGNFSLSVKFDCGVQHFKILTDHSGKYFLWVVKFGSLNDLVEYHKNSSVSRTQQIFLRKACLPKEEVKVKALYDFTTNVENELNFKKGDIITLVAQPHDEWWDGAIMTDSGVRRGIFPRNYVAFLDDVHGP